MKFILLILFTLFSTVSLAASSSRLKAVINQYKNFDINNDGTNEINDLKMYYSSELELNDISEEYTRKYQQKENLLHGSRPVVIVLVEKRLLDHERTSSRDYNLFNLEKRFDNLREDLEREGKDVHFIVTDLYNGGTHQDGRIVLALRRMFKDIHTLSRGNFEGALLIGSFPETQIIHRYIWRKEAETQISGVQTNERGWLRIVPEVRAANSDIILSDLDGNWENLYFQPRTAIPFFKGIPSRIYGNDWHKNNQYTVFSTTETGVKHFEDFFLVNDADFMQTGLTRRQKRLLNAYKRITGERVISPKALTYSKRHLSLEATSEDLRNPNPMAQPEIMISRINPKQISLTPRDNHGGENGRPVEVSSDTDIRFNQDKDLERKLLIEYLDHNHKFRNGGYSDTPYRGGGIAAEDFSSQETTNHAHSADASFDAPVSGPENANLIDYVDFLKKPMRLRSIVAHSSSRSSTFNYQIPNLYLIPEPLENNYMSIIEQQINEALTLRIGDQIYNWWNDESYNIKRVSLRNHVNGYANFFLMKSIYHSETLRDVPPSFIIHSGCNFTTQPGFNNRPYNSFHYGKMQNSNSLLFYGKALTIVGRSKVFNDTPFENDGLHHLDLANNEFGVIVKEYLKSDSLDASMAPKVAANKRAYSWSVLGDWTLKLDYEPTEKSHFRVGGTYVSKPVGREQQESPETTPQEGLDENQHESTPERNYSISDNSSSLEAHSFSCRYDDLDILFEQAGEEDPFSCVKNYCESPEVLADLYPYDLTPEEVFDWWMEDGRNHSSLFDENGGQDNDSLSSYISRRHNSAGGCLDYYCGNDPTCKLRYIRFEGNLDLAKATANSCLGNYLSCIEVTGESYLLTDLLEPQDSMTSPVNEYIRQNQQRLSSCIERYNSCNHRNQRRFNQIFGAMGSRNARSRGTFTPRF